MHYHRTLLFLCSLLISCSLFGQYASFHEISGNVRLDASELQSNKIRSAQIFTEYDSAGITVVPEKLRFEAEFDKQGRTIYQRDILFLEKNDSLGGRYTLYQLLEYTKTGLISMRQTRYGYYFGGKTYYTYDTDGHLTQELFFGKYYDSIGFNYTWENGSMTFVEKIGQDQYAPDANSVYDTEGRLILYSPGFSYKDYYTYEDLQNGTEEIVVRTVDFDNDTLLYERGIIQDKETQEPHFFYRLHSNEDTISCLTATYDENMRLIHLKNVDYTEKINASGAILPKPKTLNAEEVIGSLDPIVIEIFIENTYDGNLLTGRTLKLMQNGKPADISSIRERIVYSKKTLKERYWPEALEEE